jgi:rare lipoprotein A
MKVTRIYAAAALAAVFMLGCQKVYAECGIASTYSSGSKTANGERYNHLGVSAAHKTLPFGTRVVVRNQRTGRSITVRINDRGPFIGGRIIDLSTGAKNALGMGGLAPVCLEVVSFGDGRRGVQNAVLRHPVRKARAGHRRHYAKAHAGIRYVSSTHHRHRARGSARRRTMASNG